MSAKKLTPGTLPEQQREQDVPQPVSKFITAYGPKRRCQQGPGGPSMTKQSFKDECDVNQIMRRYQDANLPLPTDENAGYGDVTGVEYQAAMLLVAGARSQFESLPSSVRLRFANDPGRFLDFVQTATPDQLADAGLLSQEAMAARAAAAGKGGSSPDETVPPAAPEKAAPPEKPTAPK